MTAYYNFRENMLKNSFSVLFLGQIVCVIIPPLDSCLNIRNGQDEPVLLLFHYLSKLSLGQVSDDFLCPQLVSDIVSKRLLMFSSHSYLHSPLGDKIPANIGGVSKRPSKYLLSSLLKEVLTGG